MKYTPSVQAALGILLALTLVITTGVVLRRHMSRTEEPSTPAISTKKEVSGPGKAGYIEIVDSCGPYHTGVCVNARSGPGMHFPAAAKLRNGIVLAVSGTIERDGMTWYAVVFDEWVRYPERMEGDWYVSADFARYFTSPGKAELSGAAATTAKRILIDRTTQMLYAYDGERLFMEEHISSGLYDTPTPRGSFIVFRKTPSRYMQGPLPDISDEYYDLPGVPWNLYFTAEGGAIHGAYWHDEFGQPHSHGCVNLPLESAKKLYAWADLGTPVTVQD